MVSLQQYHIKYLMHFNFVRQYPFLHHFLLYFTLITSQRVRIDLNHHNVEASNIHLPTHPVFTEYLVQHFFSDRAAFLATTLKVLLFSAIENQAPGSIWMTEQNLLSLRRTTLNAINHQISTSPRVQDATICAIICLGMFEVHFQQDMRIHLAIILTRITRLHLAAWMAPSIFTDSTIYLQKNGLPHINLICFPELSLGKLSNNFGGECLE